MRKTLIAIMLLGGFSFQQSAYANLEVEFRASFTQPTCTLTGPAVVDIGAIGTVVQGTTPFTLTTICEAGATVALWAETIRGEPITFVPGAGGDDLIAMERDTPLNNGETAALIYLSAGAQGIINPWGNGVNDASVRFCATDGTAGNFTCDMAVHSGASPSTGRGNYSAVVRFSMVYQ
ncbi:hypothetical protein IHA49_002674 [Salmonella enterica]|nr:hypothetical protein [Salmonella enterica]EGJ0496215.1 hypothetical protein [Salmonella enterica]EGL9362280.1 hypothetical protein [Salmonella enterica]EGL9530104.1 hypothetical protein [Salmonella enterica]EGL9745797.1 hypothetical protein [Salmonella enterica]